MRRFDLRSLLPNLWLAAGMLVASLFLVHAGASRWTVFGAALLLALAVLSADLWRARLQGLPARLSAAALIMSAAVLLAGLMIGADDPRHAQAFIPVLCAVAATGGLRNRRCRSWSH